MHGAVSESLNKDVELASSRSFIEPIAAVPERRLEGWKRSLILGALFVMLSFVRAIHPTVITASKSKLWDGTTGFAYSRDSPICIFPVVIFVSFQFVVLSMYGIKGWKSIWTPTPMLIFGTVGAFFALHDWLEMVSLGRMRGAAYQILSQSKILITAFLMMPARGVYQTRMQWTLLFTLMLAMSVYMCIVGSDQSSDRDVPQVSYATYGIMFFNVTFTCMGAVFADRYAKKFAQTVPIPIQLVQLSLARMLVTNVLVNFRKTELWSHGLFHGWDSLTVAVLVSFCFKNVFSYMVIAIMDAVMKNMAECVAVLLIFFYDVLSPWVDYEFHLPTFLSVLVIVGLIAVYVDSKALVEKVNKYEASNNAAHVQSCPDGHPAFKA